MNRTVISTFLALALLSGTVSIAENSTPANANKIISNSITSDTVDVQHVIDAYHEAVLTHDGARLASLFIPQGSMWLNVLSDETYAHAKAESPDAQKIRVGNFEDFAKMVSTSKANLNPTHTHLQENSDGTITSVYFDFVFFIDGKPTNRGSETWVLVKGSEGWRIAAITFSSNPATP